MKHVKLFSLSTCPSCKQVKKFLDEQKIPYTVIEVDTLDSGEQWLMTKELKKYNPGATFPTVVIEETIVGPDIVALKAKLLNSDGQKS